MFPNDACRGPSLLTRKRFGAKPNEWDKFLNSDDSVNFLEDDNPFNDPFKYHPFKGMAFPPTDYIGPDDPRETDGMSSLTLNALRLKFVHGYTTRNGSRSNLFYNAQGNIVYHAAALGLVYDKISHAQYHFHGHDDDITALDMNPKDRLTVVTGQLGKNPMILVWSSKPDAHGHLPIQCVINGDHKRAIIGLSFSRSGKFIASMGNDNNRSIALYEWGKDKTMDKMRIGVDKGSTDEVYQLCFNPVTDHVVAGGKKILRFFGLKDGAMSNNAEQARAAAKQGQQHTATLSDSESKIWAKKGTFGIDKGAQDILSLAFDENGITYAGSGDGFIYRFKEQATDLAIKAHPLPNGMTNWPTSRSLCRVTALWYDLHRKRLVSSGDDGWIHVWDVLNWDTASGGKARPHNSFDLNKYVLQQLHGTIVKMDDKELDKPDSIRGSPAAAHALYGDVEGNLLVGTVCNEIYEVEIDGGDSAKVICRMQGHFEELWGLAMHPGKLQFATAAEDHTLRVFDLEAMHFMIMRPLAGPLRCCCYSPDGSWIGVGMGGGAKENRLNGKWVVCDANTLTLLFEPPQVRFERVCDIKFTPDGKWIAVANADNGIDVYSAPTQGQKGFRRVAKFEGHSSFVNHIDWSENSKCLATNCGAHELLYWKLWDEHEDGTIRFRPHQEKSSSNMRDEEWATQTCIYGWPVRGVWPEGADGTDINGICRCNTGTRSLVATSDDFGKVKLFRYPCIVPYADHKPYSGHASHVTNISFSADDKWLCSTGGADAAVFQWEVIREKRGKVSTPR
jgi:microtubule-associated protein-like 6